MNKLKNTKKTTSADFEILRSIKKVDGINFNIEPSSQVYFDTCSLKEYYPVRFRIANWISRVK